MARVLIVGCGCRGRELASALARRGHTVRGTTRTESGLGPIEAAGAEAVVADPDRLATLMPHLEGVTVLCWLMGSAVGEPDAVAAVNGPRLTSMVEGIVDTPVRGIVLEGAGTAGADVLAEAAATVTRIAAIYAMPAEVLDADPADLPAWLEQAVGAVDRVLLA